jgi:subtilisin family serine protease
MSLGGDGSLLNSIVATMQQAGMVICVAAGNESGDLDRTIDVYPAESPNVLTVNSLNNTERPSWFNNYGSVCDVFAPGEGIIAAGIKSTTWWSRMSGTSMATPHVAGVCALVLEGQPIYKSKSEVDNFYKAVLASATADKVIFDGDWSGFDSRFVNKIVYSLMEKDTPDPVIVPEVPAPVITDPVIAPSPVPVPGVPAPEKDDGGSKKWIIIGAVVAVVVGIVIAVVV